MSYSGVSPFLGAAEVLVELSLWASILVDGMIVVSEPLINNLVSDRSND